MGHLANATAFRLGKVKKWAASWINEQPLYKKLLIEDFIIFRFIKLFFIQYSIPFFNESYRRNKKTESLAKKSGLDDIIQNPFIKKTLSFSHTHIIRNNYLTINNYLLDSKLEEWRSKFYKSMKLTAHNILKPKLLKGNRPKQLNDFIFISKFKKRKNKIKIYKQKRKKYFKFHIYRNKKRYRRTKNRRQYILLRKINKKLNNSRIFLKYKLWYYKLKLIRFIPIKKKNKRNKKNSKYYSNYLKDYSYSNSAKLLRLFPYINFLTHRNNNISQILLKNRFKLLKIFLCIFTQKIQTWHQKYFFLIIFRRLLLSIIPLYPYMPLFSVFKILNLLRIKEYSFKHINLYFFRHIYNKRFLIFNSANSAIYTALKSFDKNDQIKISFISLHRYNITAAQICNYISIKLSQYFKLFEILTPTIRLLKRANTIKGFRILIVGRLTRRERAAHIIRHKGSIPLSTKTKNIDYAMDHKIMRFGVVGIKVWLHLRSLRPSIYRFDFINKSFIKH